MAFFSKVLVTGASGHVGAAVVRELLDHGYVVRGLDQKPLPADLRGRIEMVYATLTDRLAMFAAAEGCDAVAHLAAIPHPQVPNPQDIIPVNVVGTANLLEASERLGIKRFVIASTCCTFGFYFAVHPFDADYLPLDENHPLRPQDLYGLSKTMMEEACAAYTQRNGMTTVALRLTTVTDFSHGIKPWLKHHLTNREEKRRDYWTYVMISDAARSFRLALENAPEGTSANLIIAARDSFTVFDTHALVKKYFPQQIEPVAGLSSTASLYDTRRAEAHIGFVANDTWRDLPELADVAASAPLPL